MVDYLRSYIPNLSDLSAPLRELLKHNIEWIWLEKHHKALRKIKALISAAPILRNFDENKLPVIQTDASENGLGCCLLQEGMPVTFASRALTNSEKNFPQIEKKFLSIVFACQRFHHYIYMVEKCKLKLITSQM